MLSFQRASFSLSGHWGGGCSLPPFVTLCVPTMGWTSLWEHQNLRAAAQPSPRGWTAPPECAWCFHTCSCPGHAGWKQTDCPQGQRGLSTWQHCAHALVQPGMAAVSLTPPPPSLLLSSALESSGSEFRHKSGTEAAADSTVPFCKRMLAVSEVGKHCPAPTRQLLFAFAITNPEKCSSSWRICWKHSVFILNTWTQHMPFSSQQHCNVK